MTWLHYGGPVMWAIALCSVLAFSLFIQRWFHLHRAQIKSGDFLKGIFNNVQRGNIVEAVSICEETPGPVAQIVRAAILEHKQGPARVLQVMQEVGMSEITRLEKHLGLILTLAQTAPIASTAPPPFPRQKAGDGSDSGGREENPGFMGQWRRVR